MRTSVRHFSQLFAAGAELGVRHRCTKRDANDNNDFLFREWCLTPNFSHLDRPRTQFDFAWSGSVYNNAIVAQQDAASDMN